MTCSYAKEFSKSAFTDVENAFINEYLPESTGDAVKVYLYGLFLCQHPEQDKGLDDIASTLNMSADSVKSCFMYWEEFGLLSIVSIEPFAVQYLPVRSSFSSKPRKYKAEKYTEFTKSIQALLPSRMISTGEYTEYFNIMETYSIKPEAMIMIVKYCTDRKGSDVGYRYISTVAKDFGNRGINTVDKVEKELASYIMRTGVIERILKALSLKRQPEIEDSTLLKKWTQDLNFEEENIVFAASKVKKGGMAKLDAFLLELYSIKSFSKEEISDYVNKKESIYELAIKINKALSVYVEVLDTMIDTYIKKWISYGFTDETLLMVASHCFKRGSNTLQDMDALLETLRNRGFIDLSSVGDYFENEKKQDEFIQKVLTTAGINRRPNPWDRENLAMWKTWNFSNEMILEACKLSAGKSSPIAYVNGILSSWKNKGIFNVSDISTSVSVSTDSQESYNREYERRRMNALSTAQKNTDTAMSIDGFSAVYGRLNGIEKDLAFAEINGDSNALAKLEAEKKELLTRAENLLEKHGLTLRDLSPRFMCEKCNDTGYVGTHRCDCFNK
ncbi:MAG: DnaD domain protein [Clostridiales bacterium]|nr:DnaD domain protein [Clostridiales bacterium]